MIIERAGRQRRLARWRRAVGRRPRRWRFAAALVVLGIVLALTSVALNRSPSVTVSSQFLTGTPESDGVPVRLDTSLYRPADVPAPAILLAHGLGGTKTSLDAQARDLARHGYVVLAYSARGFGRSGGLIHLDSLDYEVADGSRLLDYLQSRPEVLQRAGEPVVGVAGSSYGGALALMLGATDHRIGAVAADITWNNLTTALFPNASRVIGTPAAGPVPGVFKKLWVGYLFSSATGDPQSSAAVPPAGASPVCGRFAADVCAFYQRSGTSGGELNPAESDMLMRSSPAAVLDRMRAPTLLTQGEQDSLFPLSEADANARQLHAAGAQVQVRWRAGGHDAIATSDDVFGWQRAFFDERLRGSDGSRTGFLMAERGAAISATTGQTVDTTLRAAQGYPLAGAPAAPLRELSLAGPAQTVMAPPGGNPAAVTSLPQLGGLLNSAAESGLIMPGGISLVPGQSAEFVTAPLSRSALVTGSSSVTLRIASLAPVAGPAAGPTGSRAGPTAGSERATLFVSLRDIAPDGSSVLPANLVSPASVPLAPGKASTVMVSLPWVVARVPAGHQLGVFVSTTDFGYAMPANPRSYRIPLSPAAPNLAVPALGVSTVRNGSLAAWPVAAAAVVVACALFLAWRLRSRRPAAFDPELADVPVAVVDLVKQYADGYRAVGGVTFRVERGQVLGLLGPNGAGKTTTLRVLMGLIMPSEGSVRVFGEPVVPGAAVLARLGAFVEGPGLLPHLSGSENLRLYWAASGRTPQSAQFATVLEIAGLGGSIDRRVKTYSHGMQQRLAIAQAMLGLPEVLVLDEPTNGLDPPQIAEMREVLRRYAATGRTVIISSHLLAEVEQTCSHVVVLADGKLVAAGSVTEVAGAGVEQLVVADPELALRTLAEAGISARAVPARRALEDVFLDLIGERRD